MQQKLRFYDNDQPVTAVQETMAVYSQNYKKHIHKYTVLSMLKQVMHILVFIPLCACSALTFADIMPLGHVSSDHV